MAINEVDILIESIAKWHHDRNLIEGSDDKSQLQNLFKKQVNYLIIFVKAMIYQMTLVI